MELLLILLIPVAIGILLGNFESWLHKSDLGEIIWWVCKKIGWLLVAVFILGIIGVFNV